MQVLHAVLYSFLIVFTRRICQTIKSFFEFAIISYILMTLISDSGVRLLGEIPVEGLMRYIFQFTSSQYYFLYSRALCKKCNADEKTKSKKILIMVCYNGVHVF